MKRFLAVLILLAAGITVFAQGTERPTSAQTKQNASQYLDQGRSNSEQYDSTFADLNARNKSNNDTAAFNQLKADIEKLDVAIAKEQNDIKAKLDSGVRVSPEVFQRLQRLMNQHNGKLAELEAFTKQQ